MVRDIPVKLAIFFMLIIEAFLIITTPAFAEVVCSNKDDCQNKIKEYEEKLTAARAQKGSLTSQIQLTNTKVELAQVRIQKTQHDVEATQNEIAQLTDKIEQLNSTLDHLSVILLQKIVQGYKNKGASMLDVLLSPEASTLTNQLKYIQIAQENDRLLALRTQQVKVNFSEQKTLREDKKVELEKLEKDLAAQKVDLKNQISQKNVLLEQTKNDEATYQKLLSKARAEFAAIQGIVSGAGTETKMREVSKGDIIAFVISGASCNSTGTHLHFIVKSGNTVINPFSQLKNIDFVNYAYGDPFNPSGSWDWPLSPPIRFNQGYGVTNYVLSGGWYDFHNGIDIASSSNAVLAVESGTLYRGSYSGNGGCTLPYVKLEHKDSDYSTLYLHVFAQ